MKVLFVCLGNTCRSPFAEGLARRLAGERGIEAEFASAGEIALSGRGSPPDAVDAALAYGVDLSGHRSQRLTPELAARFDHVVLLHHVPDPIGGGPDAYRERYGLLRSEVEALLDRLYASSSQPSSSSSSSSGRDTDTR